MKKIVLLSAAILVSAATYAGNKKLKQGKVSYTVTYDLDAEKQQMAAMLPTNVDVYFKSGKSCAETSGGMISQRIITESNAGDSYALMELMGEKVAIKTTRGEAVSKISANGTPEVNITKETKDIAGYKCTKAIISFKNQPSFDVWFTTELEGVNGGYARYEGIEGMMLQYEVKVDGIGMKYTCTSVTELDVDDAKFVVPQDYRTITMADLQHMNPADRGGQ